METYALRLAERRDIPRIDAMMARSYPKLLAADYPPSVLVTAVPMIARAQPALVDSGTYFVVEGADGAIVGAGGWTVGNPHRTPGDPVLGNVRHFATDPDVLRQGIARRLMDKCQSEVRHHGLAGLNCMSTRTAIRFYQAMGFEALGEVTIQLAGGIDFPAERMVWRA